MKVTGPIYSIDLGQRAGFAVGAPGQVPRSGAVILKGKDDPRRTAHGNLIAFLDEQWSGAPPAMVVVVPPPTIQAHVRMHHNESAPRLQYGLHAIVEGMCDRFGLALVEIHEDTVRKHFIGKGRLGDRESTKLAVISRCHLLRLMPADCMDDNRADALALHDWACASYGRSAVSTNELHFFDQHQSSRKRANTRENSRVAAN
jgi:hypothetical protein